MVKFYREALKRRRQADHRRGSAGARGRRAARADAPDAAVPEPRRLPQPDAAGQPRLPRRARNAALRADASATGSPRRALDGLIALSGAARGRRRPRAGQRPRARRPTRRSTRWLELFRERFYLELQRLGRPDRGSLHRRRRWARRARAQCRSVATNDVRFLQRRATSRRTRRASASTTARCSPIRRGVRRYSPPAVPAQPGGDGRAVRRSARGAGELGGDRAPLQPGAQPGRGAPAAVPGARRREHRAVPAPAKPDAALGERLAAGAAAPPAAYHARLETELDVICQMGFAGYFLIVADFIRWAREQRRPGRARGAARAPARSSPTRCASPTSTRSRTTCCSSAS